MSRAQHRAHSWFVNALRFKGMDRTQLDPPLSASFRNSRSSKQRRHQAKRWRGGENPRGFDGSAGLPIRTAKPPAGRGTWMYRVNPPRGVFAFVSQFHASVVDARLWWPRRPLATLDRKPRQGRKAATVSVDAGAEVSRRGHRHFRASHGNPKVRSANLGPGFMRCLPWRCDTALRMIRPSQPWPGIRAKSASLTLAIRRKRSMALRCHPEHGEGPA